MNQNNNDYMTPEVINTSLECENILCASNDCQGNLEDIDITYEEW